MKVETKKIEGETWIKFNSNYDRTRYFYGNILIIIFLIILIVFMVVTLTYIYRNVEEIKSNPFIYAANKRMRGEVYCECIEERNDNLYGFRFNNTAWWAIPTYLHQIPSRIKEINTTEWEEALN